MTPWGEGRRKEEEGLIKPGVSICGMGGEGKKKDAKAGREGRGVAEVSLRPSGSLSPPPSCFKASHKPRHSYDSARRRRSHQQASGKEGWRKGEGVIIPRVLVEERKEGRKEGRGNDAVFFTASSSSCGSDVYYITTKILQTLDSQPASSHT